MNLQKHESWERCKCEHLGKNHEGEFAERRCKFLTCDCEEFRFENDRLADEIFHELIREKMIGERVVYSGSVFTR